MKLFKKFTSSIPQTIQSTKSAMKGDIFRSVVLSVLMWGVAMTSWSTSGARTVWGTGNMSQEFWKKSDSVIKTGGLTEDQYQKMLPRERRLELAQQAKDTLFWFLKIERKDPKSGEYGLVPISEFDQSSLAKLFSLLNDSFRDSTWRITNLAPLFLAWVQDESVLGPDIYRDQKVILTIPPLLDKTVVFRLNDAIPLDINAIEYNGRVYLRKSATKNAVEAYKNLNDEYNAGIGGSKDFLERRNQIPLDFFHSGEKVLHPRDGMLLRLISDDTLARIDASANDVSAKIDELVRVKNYLSFERKYAKEIQTVSKKFPAHTLQDTTLLLRLIGRVNPDFSASSAWGLARMYTNLYESTRATLKLPSPSGNIAEELEIVWSFYHQQILSNESISEIARNAAKVNAQAEYTDKNLDIERQVRGLFFNLISFVEKPSSIPTELIPKFTEIVRDRLDREPEVKEVENAYLNFAYLKKLQELGIIPSDMLISETDMISVGDFTDMMNDLAEYLGIWDLEKPGLKNGWKLIGVDATIAKLSKLFYHQMGMVNGTEVTMCMVNVRKGLSSLLNVTIWGVGDMVHIYKKWIPEYASHVKEMFERQNAWSRFFGYIPEFGREHFTAPEGANVGMLFTDTRYGNGSKWGHVSFIMRAPNGTWFVKDDYYKGPLGSFKSVQDFFSSRNPRIWSKLGKWVNLHLIGGAIFFKADISHIPFPQELKNAPIVASK